MTNEEQTRALVAFRHHRYEEYCHAVEVETGAVRALNRDSESVYAQADL